MLGDSLLRLLRVWKAMETLALSSSILLSILEIADTEKLTLLPQTIFLRKS